MIRIYPLIFILLWSSAFITTKPIVDNSDPFAALAFRFFFVALGFYLFSFYLNQSLITNKRKIAESVLSGVLFHGFYLGGVFYSISIGMPVGIAALIVTLQPVLTNILSGPILDEKITTQQWIGVLLGFTGASLVLGLDIGSGIPLLGLIATIIALLSITISTIWQKKISKNLPLSVSNFYQAFGGCLFHVLIVIFFAEPYINFNKVFIIAMSHQVFFLIPSTSALMAWFFLNEKLTNLDVVGFIVTSVGVYIATRE